VSTCVRRPVLEISSASALIFAVHARSEARAARSKAPNAIGLTEPRRTARSAAASGGARCPQRGTERDTVASNEIDLSKVAVFEAVDTGVVGRVACAVAQHDIKVGGRSIGSVDRANVDESNGVWGVDIGTASTEVVVSEVGKLEVKAHALADARLEGRRRWRRRRGRHGRRRRRMRR
jgi:hypothetical protein